MSDSPRALLSAEESAKADEIAERRGISGMALMREAGRRAAREILRHEPHARRVHILCGPGNNGGDGYIVARILEEAGRDARIFRLGGVPTKGDAATAAKECAAPVSSLRGEGEELDTDIIIDALFGTGLKRDMEGAAASLAAQLRDSGVPVIALDIPSGIDADTGAIRGEAFQASRTISFFRAKRGHYLIPGRFMRGALSVVDIGIPPDVETEIAPSSFLNAPSLWLQRFPFPNPAAHKYERGFALILSGDALHTGAARLSAMSALRSGAGLVSVLGEESALAVHARHLTSIMLELCPTPEVLGAILEDRRKNAVLIGPAASVGERTRRFALTALASGASVALDADALTSFAGHGETLFRAIAEKNQRGEGATVLTPHEGEFKRLFPDIKGDKLRRAVMAAQASGAVILLKGADTVIASPDGRAYINATGGAYLATAGTGDVLAGIITGLLAQGMGAMEAAASASWIHGEAEMDAPGTIAEDLPARLPSILTGLRDRFAL